MPIPPSTLSACQAPPQPYLAGPLSAALCYCHGILSNCPSSSIWSLAYCKAPLKHLCPLPNRAANSELSSPRPVSARARRWHADAHVKPGTPGYYLRLARPCRAIMSYSLVTHHGYHGKNPHPTFICVGILLSTVDLGSGISMNTSMRYASSPLETHLHAWDIGHPRALFLTRKFR